MVYRGCLISHGGKIRLNNEDNAYLDGLYRSDDSLFSWQSSCERRKDLLCAVFDGVGGEDSGEVASRIAAETLAEYDGRSTVSDLFQEYVQLANDRINLDIHSNRMASTFVILSVEDDCYHFCNMGDSRGYLFRDKRLVQLSEDHNMVSQLTKTGVLTTEQAARHPDRHTIYQYLGMKEGSGDYELTLDPYTSEAIPALKKDICLLCSDGLTDMVSDENIIKILSEEITLESKTMKLVETALEHGGRDNITVILMEASKH
jgi:protein phosphatase